MTGPSFRDLVGDDVPAVEEARLRRIHDLLVAAGPPADLPTALATPPRVGGEARVRALPTLTSRRAVQLLLAASLAAAVFAGGFLTGRGGDSFQTRFTAEMRGTALAPRALASIRVGMPDSSGNWPMVVHVKGLEDLPKGGVYYLYLSRHGKPIAPCGGFVVHGGKASFRLSAGYRLKAFTGWIVTRRLPGQKKPSEAALLTTPVA